MIEIVALFLVVVDFAGWTSELERWLVKATQAIFKVQSFVRTLGGKYRENYDTMTKIQLAVLCVVFVLVVGYCILEAMRDDISRRLYDLLLIAGRNIMLPLALAMFLAMFLFPVYLLIFTPLIVVLRLMGRAPRGIVGSISLLIAIISLIARFAN